MRRLLSLTLLSVSIFAIVFCRSAAAQGVPVQVRGGCAILNVRQGPGNADYSFCDRIPQSQFSVYLGWLPDFLSAAFDNAERQSCGTIRCVVGSRSADLVIYNDAFANASVSFNGTTMQNSNHLTFMFSTGLVDMTEAATTAYLVESNDPTNGLSGWIHTIDERTATDCKFHLPAPFHPIDQNTFTMVRGGAQIMYQFVLGHEFAHLQLGGAACGLPSADSLADESACDRYSFEHEWNAGDMAPNFVIIPLIVMAHYDSLLDQRWGSLIFPSGGMTLKELFPAADWKSRATKVADLWTSACNSPGATSKPACKGQWQDILQNVRSYIAISVPQPCRDSSGSRQTELAPAGSMESQLCSTLKTFISSSQTDFTSLHGTAKKNADGELPRWNSTLILPGSQACTIFPRDGSAAPFLSCHYPDTQNASEAKNTYQTLVNQIASCLSDWAGSDESTTSKSVTRFTRQGIDIVVSEGQLGSAIAISVRIEGP